MDIDLPYLRSVGIPWEGSRACEILKPFDFPFKLALLREGIPCQHAICLQDLGSSEPNSKTPLVVKRRLER